MLSNIITFLLLVSATLPFAATYQNLKILWNCALGPNVCENMCWGINCAGNGQKYKTLTWDNPVEDVKVARRKAAGCLTEPGRCVPPAFPAGYNCDEFPFAPMSEADDGNSFSRCVPERENSLKPGSSQESVIDYMLLAQCPGVPCKIDLLFWNYHPESYCDAELSWEEKCVNNNRSFHGTLSNVEHVEPQMEWQGFSLAKEPTTMLKRGFRTAEELEGDEAMATYKFLTDSGKILTAFQNYTIGETVLSFEPRNGRSANTTSASPTDTSDDADLDDDDFDWFEETIVDVVHF